jgi:cysteinyl-tRNA synthetase
MITIGGQKMGKSLGNFITLEQLFTGTHDKLEQAYSPMTVRFFILQAHYRSTLDFSNEALKAAEKGYDRLMKAVDALEKIKASESSSVNVADLATRCEEAMNDDLSSPMVISALFDWVRIINSLVDGKESITAADLAELKRVVNLYVFDILGLRNERSEGADDKLAPLMDMILEIRRTAKANKDWATADLIRNRLTEVGIRVKDNKDGSMDWEQA